jgi:very-short-patch-repair endonuclease
MKSFLIKEKSSLSSIPLFKGEVAKPQGDNFIFNGYHLPYNPDNTKKARVLRKNMTKAENKIWFEILKGKQFCGLRFLRQKPIGHYIVDFYCAQLKLVIEIDGDNHFTEEASEYDKARTNFLNALGLAVIRYSNDEVLKNIIGVHENLTKIVQVYFKANF